LRGRRVATLTLSPATFYVRACPQMNVFLYSALTSCVFVITHTFSMIIAFHGYTHHSVLNMTLPPVVHLVAALVVSPYLSSPPSSPAPRARVSIITTPR
jgi:hypothetical protein